MKKATRLFSMFFAICLTFSCVNVQAITVDDPAKTNTVIECPENFIPISREEYIRTKSEKEGITYEEAEAIVDKDIENAKASLPAPNTWDDDHIVTNPNGTFTLYGRIYKIYTHKSGLKAQYEVQAVMVASHYGKSWASCDATGSAFPYGGGYFDFEGDCTASKISNTEIRMTLSGYFDIEESVATDMGINVELFSFSTSVGNTYHYRDNIYDTHMETVRN